jgi:predicted RNase H-like nuclease (RuvC/YqgF family)
MVRKSNEPKPQIVQETRLELTIEQRVVALESEIELLQAEVEECRAWREVNIQTIERLSKRLEQYERRI